MPGHGAHRPDRARTSLIAAAAAGGILLLGACGAGEPSGEASGDVVADSVSTSASEPTVSEQTTGPAPSPPGPAPDAIRQLDPATLDWQWFESHIEQVALDVTVPDEYGRVFSVGEPVYSDADGDGLEDMAVMIDELDGNGYRAHWYIWLATAEGGAVQVPIPITAMHRCGDAVDGVTATEGGFTVHEFLRDPVLDYSLDCASRGTFEVTREVGVTHDDDGSLVPVTLTDPRGYGGVCPSNPLTETGITTVWGHLGPSITSSLTIDGEEMYIIETNQHTLTRNTEPLVLASVWPPGGHVDDRICVWVDPVRLGSTGE